MSSRTLLITCVIVIGMVTPVLAGENPSAKLALHLVASSDSLGCAELAPSACDSISLEISAEDLAAADGYGFFALVAYDIDSITGVEFALDGWPTGRGAPALGGPYWCEDNLTLGDHEGGGGLTALEACVEPDTNGIAILAYWSFGPLDSTDLPIDLSLIPSTFSDDDSLLYILDCTVDYEQDDIALASGCAIGGTYSGPEPDCGGEEDGGGTGDTGGNTDGPTDGGDMAADEADAEEVGGSGGGEGDGLGSWGDVELLGPFALEAPDTTPFYLCLKGLQSPNNDDYSWWAEYPSTSDTISMSYVDSVAGVQLCFGWTVSPDTGKWEFYGQYKEEDEHLIGKFRFYDNILRWQYRGMTSGQIDSAFCKDLFEITTTGGSVYLGASKDSTAFSRSSVPDSSLFDALDTLGNVEQILKVIRDDTRAEALGLEDTYLVRLSSPSENIIEDMSALCECRSVLGLHPIPSTGAAGVLSDEIPDEQVFDDSTLCCPYEVDKYCDNWGSAETVPIKHMQWPLHDRDGIGLNCPEAWGYDLISNNIRIAVLDNGIWWPNPEFGGDSTISYGGNNVVHTGKDWVTALGSGIAHEEVQSGYCCPNGHGTAMAGLIASKTSDGMGMAGICWGNVELGAMRVCSTELWEGTYPCYEEFGDRWWEVFDEVGDPTEHACHVASGSFSYGVYANPCTDYWTQEPRNTWLMTNLSLRRSSRKAFAEDSVAMFFAAGNEDSPVEPPPDCSTPYVLYPAAFPWVESITTTGKTGDHYPTFFHGNCGFDPLMYPYGWIDLALPAGTEGIPAPHFERCSQFWSSCKKGTAATDSLKYRMGLTSRTSAATALASGLGAMVIDAYMDRQDNVFHVRPIPEDVYGIMEWSSNPCWRDEDIPDAWRPNYHVGWGRADAGLAVYDALYADIDHYSTSYEDAMELIGSYEWNCPAGDDCGFPSRKVVATAFRITKVVSLPSGERAGCWGHHRAPTDGAAPLLMMDGVFAADVQDALDYKWCDLSAYDRFADACTLQTFVYFLVHQAEPGEEGSCLYHDPYENIYVPCPPNEATFAYTTFSSDRFLSNVSDEGSEGRGPHPPPVLEAYPQPFNPTVSIRYAIPVVGRVTMRIYNVNGQVLRTLVDEYMDPGLYFEQWDGKDGDGIAVSSGVYFCRLKVDGQATVEKMLLLR